MERYCPQTWSRLKFSVCDISLWTTIIWQIIEKQKQKQQHDRTNVLETWCGLSRETSNICFSMHTPKWEICIMSLNACTFIRGKWTCVCVCVCACMCMFSIHSSRAVMKDHTSSSILLLLLLSAFIVWRKIHYYSWETKKSKNIIHPSDILYLGLW